MCVALHNRITLGTIRPCGLGGARLRLAEFLPVLRPRVWLRAVGEAIGNLEIRAGLIIGKKLDSG